MTEPDQERDEDAARRYAETESAAGNYWKAGAHRGFIAGIAHGRERETAENARLRARCEALETALGRVSRIAPCLCPTTRPGTCNRCEALALLTPTPETTDD